MIINFSEPIESSRSIRTTGQNEIQMANGFKLYTNNSRFRRISRKVIMIEKDEKMIGFLTFEISSLMSRLIQLWNRLKDYEFTRIKEDLANSTGIRKLVSEDQCYLMELFLNDVVRDLQYVARSVSRFGEKCSDPILREFEHFINDPLKNDFEWFGWQYKWKKMDRRVEKMQRFVDFTVELAIESDVLAESEKSLKRLHANFGFNRGKLMKFKQRVTWHRRRVSNLKEITPWKRSFDYIFRLFMRSIITVVERIKLVFGIKEMPSSETRTTTFNNSPEPELYGCRPKRNGRTNLNNIYISKHVDVENEGAILSNGSEATLQRRMNGGQYSIASFFSKANLPNPPPSTLGGAALAVHYARIIILIEKFASAPHLIGEVERDELFNMLPTKIRTSLRSRLKLSGSGKVNRYSSSDEPLIAAEWKSAMTQILQWVAPLAHNMDRWHSEQSFENINQQFEVEVEAEVKPRSHALMIQTLHYANKEAVEATVTELLVALNHLCYDSWKRRSLLYPVGLS